MFHAMDNGSVRACNCSGEAEAVFADRIKMMFVLWRPAHTQVIAGLKVS